MIKVKNDHFTLRYFQPNSPFVIRFKFFLNFSNYKPIWITWFVSTWRLCDRMNGGERISFRSDNNLFKFAYKNPNVYVSSIISSWFVKMNKLMHSTLLLSLWYSPKILWCLHTKQTIWSCRTEVNVTSTRRCVSLKIPLQNLLTPHFYPAYFLFLTKQSQM